MLLQGQLACSKATRVPQMQQLTRQEPACGGPGGPKAPWGCPWMCAVASRQEPGRSSSGTVAITSLLPPALDTLELGSWPQPHPQRPWFTLFGANPGGLSSSASCERRARGWPALGCPGSWCPPGASAKEQKEGFVPQG